jgi:macrophage erythroblast attacher
MLRRQEYIELIRTKSLEDAINYARKYLLQFLDDNCSEVEQATALVAFHPSTDVYPYKWLFEYSRWVDISKQFDVDMRLLHGISEKPQLVSLINAGLSALKTPKCTNSEDKRPVNINCPTCSPPLNRLARELPLAHLETSVLVCPIGGDVMDTENIPMALPNGHVYSIRALKTMCNSEDGKVVCPRTNQIFHIKDARRCYIS